MPDPTPAPKPLAGTDAGRVPITEEMDSAKWTLPPIVPVLIALAAVAIVVGIFSFANRAKPAASGEITDVQAVEMKNGQTLVAINVKVHNTSDRTLYIKNLYGELVVPDKNEAIKDEAASPVDFERYYGGFPDLRTNAIDPLRPETKVPAGADAAGRIVVSFPVTRQQFDARKSLAVRLDLYDQRPVVITK
jgi:hypothetical protein